MGRKLRESDAAGAMLDDTIAIDIPAPWLLRKFGQKSIRAYFRLPVYATLLRISKMYTRLGIDLTRLQKGELHEVMHIIAKQGKRVSRIVATGLLRGGITNFLFCRLLAWYLRNHMTSLGMAQLAKIMLLLSGGEHFASIIKSVGLMSVTSPVLSQKETRS